MNNDEFNEIIVTNDIEGCHSEFGKTQDTEFSSYQEVGGGRRKIELNSSNESKAEHSESTNKAKEDLIKETFEGASESTAATTGATTSATAVTSAVGSTAVVAVVGATAMVVIGGVTNNARVNFEYLEYSNGSIYYGLILEDAGNDEFEIHCDGVNYSVSQPISYQEESDYQEESNYYWGSFEDVKPNQEYRIYVKQKDPSIKIIYDEKFETTLYEPKFNGIEFGYYNYETMSFTVTLDYEDESYQLQSINLLLSYDDEEMQMSDNGDEMEIEVYPLSLTTEPQEVLTNGDGRESRFVYPETPLKYEVQYYIEGDENPKTALTGKVTLEAKEQPPVEPTINTPTIGYFDVDTYIFPITLDYDDPDNQIQRMVLELSNGDTKELYDLSVTTEAQDVLTNGDGRESILVYEGNTVYVSLYYYLEGDTEGRLGYFGETTFAVDPSIVYEPVFNGASISEEYNFTEGFFRITLDYEDRSNILTSIVINLIDGQIEEEYELDITTDDQVVAPGQNSQINFKNNPVEYQIYYMVKDEEEYRSGPSGTMQFTYIDPSYVGNLIWDKTANFNTYSFDVQLDFYDDSDTRYDNFTLKLTSLGEVEDIYDDEPENPSVHEQSFTLEKTTDTQTITVEDLNVINIIRDTFKYTFTYEDNGVEVIQETGEVSFENSLHSSFNGIVTDAKYVMEDGNNCFMTIKLDYEDEANIYSNFYLIMNNENSSDGYVQLSDTNGYQYANLTNLVYAHSEDTSVIFNTPIPIQVGAYVYDMKSGEQSEKILYSGTITLEEASTSQVYGLWFDGLTIFTNQSQLNVRPIYLDPEHKIQIGGFSMIIEVDENHIYTFAIGELYNMYLSYDTIDLSDESELLDYLAVSPVKIYLKYTISFDGETTEETMVAFDQIQFHVVEGA